VSEGANIRWAGGGEARLVRISEDVLVARSTVPFPPGSRIEGTVEGEPPQTFRLKVHVSKRQARGDFLIEGRPLDLTRRARERLSAVSAPARDQGAREGADDEDDQ
jgi:hypothetical protein